MYGKLYSMCGYSQSAETSNTHFLLLMTPIIMHLNNFMNKQIILKILILLTQEH